MDACTDVVCSNALFQKPLAGDHEETESHICQRENCLFDAVPDDYVYDIGHSDEHAQQNANAIQ